MNLNLFYLNFLYFLLKLWYNIDVLKVISCKEGCIVFKVGDKIVYPMHGAGTIEAIEQKEMLGDEKDYYIIRMPIGGMKLMVPTDKADDIGVREVSSKSISDEVFDVLEKPQDNYVHDVNWSKRYNMNVEKIKSGDILEVAEVVRDLSHRHMERGI